MKVFVFKDKRLDPGDFFLTTIKKSDGIGYENQALRMKFSDVKEFFFHNFYAFSADQEMEQEFYIFNLQAVGIGLFRIRINFILK